MFFLLLLNFSFPHTHCNHDELQREILPFIKVQKKSNNLSLSDSRSNPAPIRVTFDFRFLDGTWTFPTCTYEGQRVTMFGVEITCQRNQIFTPEKIKVIKETFENVKQYLQTYIKVKNPLSDPIEVSHQFSSYYTLPEDYFQSNSDLHFIVIPYPITSFIASAVWLSLSRIDYRPIEGAIFINPSFVPTFASSFDDEEPFYFNTLYHEMMHAMCFSSNLFQYWLDSNGQPYGSNVPLIKERYKGKEFTVLSTPYIKKWLELRFGITKLTDRIPLGLELENDGGAATAGSHPEQSVYMSDIMCGLAFAGATITELSYVAMLDSGWYIPDFRGTKRLLWGWGPSFGASNLTTFLMEPYYYSFPDHYNCKNFNHESCTWNYRGYGYCQKGSINCNNQQESSSPWCQGIDFYDPLKTSFYPNLETANFFYVQPYPNGQCWISQSGTIGAGKNAFCHFLQSGNPSCIDTFCNPNGTLTLKDSNKVALCSKVGESVALGSRTIICSNPAHICGIIKGDVRWEVENIFDPQISWNTDVKEGANNNSSKVTIIIIVVVVVVVVIGIVAFLIWWNCFRRDKTLVSPSVPEKNPRQMTRSRSRNQRPRSRSSRPRLQDQRPRLQDQRPRLQDQRPRLQDQRPRSRSPTRPRLQNQRPRSRSPKY